MSDISDALQTKALEPASHSVDGQTSVQRPIADLIAADKYQRQVAAAANGVLPIRMFKLVPPGAS